MVCVTGKTELAKQVARYMHKDIKKVSDVATCVWIQNIQIQSVQQCFLRKL